MPQWDDHRGRRAEWDRDRDRDRDRWRDDDRRERWSGGDERRAFGDERGRYNSDTARYGTRGGRGEGEREAWRRDRYGSRYDQDRAQYGAGYDYARGGYGRGLEDEEGRYSGYGYAGGEPLSYAGQEYGVEGHDQGGGRSQGGGGRAGGWGFEGRGGQGGQGGRQAYGGQQRAHDEHEFDPEYVRWRDEQLQGHDRDYHEWRTHQHRQYDEDYRKFRSERREQFGRTFHDWRSQRSAVGGIPDTTVSGGVSGYGDKSAIPGGYNVASHSKPSGGMDEPAGHLSADPAMSQTGGATVPTGSSGQAQSGAAGGSEFGREPQQVKAASEGSTQRGGRDDDKRHDVDQRH